MQNVIKEKYIEHLVNEDTGLIEQDIPTVLEYLPTNYDKIPPEEVKQKEAEVLSISFNPSDPTVLLYRLIEPLQKLATYAGILYSEA